MTDPVRLLSTKLDGFSRQAIEAAVADEPPTGAKERLWSSLSVAIPAASGLLTAATTSSAQAAAANVVAGVSSGVGLLATKAIAIGFGLGLSVSVATGVIEVPFVQSVKGKNAAVESRQGSRGVPSSVPGPTPIVMPREAPLPKAVTPPPEISNPLPAQKATGFTRPTPSVDWRSGVESRGTPSVDEIRAESALLMKARRAYSEGSYTRALNLLGEHQRGFGSGKLVQERTALEAQTLLKLGRIEEARAAAESFLARYPESPHAARMRQLMGTAGQ